MPALVAVAGAALYTFLQLRTQPSTGAGGPGLGVPTTPVVAQDLERRIRIAGTTGAKNYAVLKVPQMRGGRGTSLGDVQASVSTGARTRGGGGGGGGGGVQSFRGMGGGGGGGQMGGGGGGRGGGEGPGLTLTYLIEGGTIVSKGTVVARFEDEDMRTRLDDFRVSQRQNDANMATLQSGIEVLRKSHQEAVKSAKADVDRAELDVKTEPVRSAVQAETFRLTAQEAQETYKMILNEVPLMETSLSSQWKAQQLAYQEGQAELKRLEANLDQMSLKAPIDGLVVIQSLNRRGSSDAAQIKTGDAVGYGQPVVQIVDTSSMMVNAAVNQVDAEQLRVGAKAYVHVDAFPGLELPGEVYSVGAMTRQSRLQGNYVKEIPVVVRILKIDPRLIPDLSASADVVVTKAPQALVVPREAVFRDGPEGKPYLFVQEPGGWTRREVELGPLSYVAASIKSGVSAGEIIARQRPPVAEAKKKQ